MTRKHLTATTPPQADLPAADRNADTGAATGNKSMLSEHKGKLAIGVAATLGVMIFYSWRQKNLPKEDPEGYARLQKIKDSMKADEHQHGKQANNEKPPKAAAKK